MSTERDDLSWPDGGRSNRGLTRGGLAKVARVNVVQALRNPRRQHGVFVAVIRDPETGHELHRVDLWAGSAGDQVDLEIVFRTSEVLPREELE